MNRTQGRNRTETAENSLENARLAMQYPDQPARAGR